MKHIGKTMTNNKTKMFTSVVSNTRSTGITLESFSLDLQDGLLFSRATGQQIFKFSLD